MNPIVELFRIRDIAHTIHLETTSYAEHKALDKFYTKWLELTDTYLENYQGYFGRVKMTYKETIQLNINNSDALILAANKLIEKLKLRHPDSSGLNNILDEFFNLIDETKYLLTLK